MPSVCSCQQTQKLDAALGAVSPPPTLAQLTPACWGLPGWQGTRGNRELEPRGFRPVMGLSSSLRPRAVAPASSQEG